MKRLLVAMLLCVSGALLGQVAGAPGAQEGAEAPARFATIEIHVDAGEATLGAYQIDLAGSEGVTIVGIEGGEHEAFAEPPYYDPKALMDSERVIIGAFSTDDDLPSGRTRVATVHVRLTTDEPRYELTLTTAASGDGTRIEASASLIEGSDE